MDRQPLKENSGPAPKKAKPSEKPSSTSSVVLTFALSHSPVKVELVESQTIFQLVDIICCETDVGMEGETVYDHMWDVHVPGKGKFNSSDEYADMDGLQKASQTELQQLGLALNTKLKLEYDYGSTSYYNITLVEKSTTTEPASNFPRRQKVGGVPGFSVFETDVVDLNATFPNLNQWTGTAAQLSLNLFQAGKKKNWGFLERGNRGTRHMIYLPAKPTSLADYLHTMDYAAQFKPSGGYNWYSMVVLPHDNSAAYNKYARELEPGFCDAKVAPAATGQQLNLEQVFPKVAALAGFASKKDPSVPKGWITYNNNILRICTGKAQVIKSNAPKNCAYDGIDAHNPEDPIIAEMDVKIKSMHHLFCAVEGLLRTL